jgi:glycosyltransferase involved in cell wall biosynthesis
MLASKIKICYFGIYNPELGRNRVYIKGLKENGAEILECRDNSWGPFKFLKLFWKHWKIRNSYDFLIVGYPGHVLVPFAKFISSKPVVFDALCTMYEGVILSRGQTSKSLYVQIIDWLAVKSADLILVESEEQRKYFALRFGESKKYKVIYTGAEISVFYLDPNIKKREEFTVLFRGKFLPEAGVKYVVEAAKLLPEANFLIIGNGFLFNQINSQISQAKSQNIELISRNLSPDELRAVMLSAHVSLGQLETHERLKRTIPHKAYESLALGLPYVTARTKPIEEIMTEGETCLFVNPADPRDLSEKILKLKDDPRLGEEMSKKGLQLFQHKFTPKVLASQILQLIQ